MAAVQPGAMNAYIRDHDASNKLVIDYARNINKFPVSRYTQVINAKKMAGYYLEMTVEEAGRILFTDLRQFVWADGQAAPEGHENLESFEYKPFECRRYAYPFLLGQLTQEQASWNVLAQNASIKSRQAMTARTQSAINTLTTAGNYSASHVLDVTAISGNTGNWAQSTTARQDIKRSITTAIELILDDTLNAIDPDDLVLVISSGMAADLAQTQEIIDYIKGSPDALAQIKGELPNRNQIYNIPDKLYGLPVIVEATRKVTTRKGATTSRSSVLAKGTPFITSRPGGMVGVADAPNFSTCVAFMHEEMTVETLTDAPNRRTIGRVVENYVYKMVAPATGILFTNAA